MSWISRRSVFKGASASALALTSFGRLPAFSATAEPRPFLAGVNLAGAEFGSRMPGVFGTDYTYPPAASIGPYRSLGFSVIRLPFRWERLQPDLAGAFDSAEWQRLSVTVDGILSHGMHVILDVHNFARRRVRADGFSAEHLIGSTSVPASSFASFWNELARRTANRPGIIYGLMNEPYDLEAAAWLDIAQAALAAIRETGARNLVLVPGTNYSGAHSWLESGNDIIARLDDPARNMAIDVHQYLDADSSGTQPVAISRTIGSQRIRAFQAWCRKTGMKAFLGEFGAGSDAVSLAALRDLLREVHANRDVWIGWAAWAAGPWWPPDYFLRLEPLPSGEVPPQLQLLSEMARDAVNASGR